MAKFKVQEMQSSLLQVKHILSISWFHKVTPRASVCGILNFTDRVITLKQMRI